MRRFLALLVLAGLAPAARVSAAALSSASLTFQFASLPGTTFAGSGATGTSTSNLSAGLNAGSAIGGNFTTTIPTSAAPVITVVQVVVTQNAGGTFTGTTPDNVGGNHAFTGVFRPYLSGSYQSGGGALLSVPLVIGTPSTVYKAGGGVAITAIAGGWTAETATVTGTFGTAMAAGSNALTPNGSGTLVLVSPFKVVSNYGPSYALNGASFAVLTLTYVPEPSTLVLLGLGVASLAALTRQRM